MHEQYYGKQYIEVTRRDIHSSDFEGFFNAFHGQSVEKKWRRLRSSDEKLKFFPLQMEMEQFKFIEWKSETEMLLCWKLIAE